jgi:hypothetical protein
VVRTRGQKAGMLGQFSLDAGIPAFTIFGDTLNDGRARSAERTQEPPTLSA